MEKVCGTCKHNQLLTRATGVLSKRGNYEVITEWECTNELSDNYTYYTDFDDTCDEWEEK